MAIPIQPQDYFNAHQRARQGGFRVLKPGGGLAVVSFHSLEDRIVKRFLAEGAGKQASTSRYMPEQAKGPEPAFQLKDRHGIEPSEDEIAANPRARSARLRWAIRTEAPARD